jgi:transcription initiation factor TFIIIB Brf1 subunit/transcription initiation factor TFIIB
MSLKCESCGSQLVVDKGFYVCPLCGTVYEVVFEEGGDYVYSSEVGSFIPITEPLGLPHVKLSYNARAQALLRARRLLKALRHVLNLNENEYKVILDEFIRFAAAAARKGVKLRRSALLLALIYLRKRERLVRVNMKALVNELRKRGVRVRHGDILNALHFLRSEGAVAEDWEQLLRTYVRVLASLTNISSERLQRRAEELLTSSRKYLTGRSPRNVAAAVVYVAGELEGAAIPLFRYARATDVPVSSLKPNVDLVRSLVLER